MLRARIELSITLRIVRHHRHRGQFSWRCKAGKFTNEQPRSRFAIPHGDRPAQRNLVPAGTPSPPRAEDVAGVFSHGGSPGWQTSCRSSGRRRGGTACSVGGGGGGSVSSGITYNGPTSWAITGPEGGPFSNGSLLVVLDNQSAQPVAWSASSIPSFVLLDHTSGTIAANTTVRIQ